MKTNTCPKCGHTYQGYPALSRVDNRTEICPDCGIREALENACMQDYDTRRNCYEEPLFSKNAEGRNSLS